MRFNFKKILFVSCTVFLLIVSTQLCFGNSIAQSPIEQSSCRSIQHALGQTCISQTPKRLATLSTTDLVSALALGVKPIATVFYNNPNEVPSYLQGKLDQIQVLGTNDQPSIEQALYLKPDLLLGMDYSVKPIYSLLSRIAPTVVYAWQGTPSWRDHFNFVAEALGRSTEAKQAWAHYYDRIRSLKAALEKNTQRSPKISVFHICCGAMHVDVKNSFNGSILEDVGLQRPPAQNIVVEGGVEFISGELLPEMIDADVLFIPADPQDKASNRTLSELMNSPLWQKLKVVQQGKVYLVDYDIWRGANLFAADRVIDDLFHYLVDPIGRSTS